MPNGEIGCAWESNLERASTTSHRSLHDNVDDLALGVVLDSLDIYKNFSGSYLKNITQGLNTLRSQLPLSFSHKHHLAQGHTQILPYYKQSFK